MKTKVNHARLLGMLCCLMLLFVSWQFTFLTIHYQITDIFQSVAGTSLVHGLLHFTILLPIFVNILIQVVCYGLIVIFCWRIAIGIGERFHFSTALTYCLGIVCLGLSLADLLVLNSYLFPLSFFAAPTITSNYFLLVSAAIWVAAIVIAYRQVGWLLVGLIALNSFTLLPPLNRASTNQSQQPNIILIGLDSLRPDFTGFYGKRKIKTPTIDAFLQQAAVFDSAYTPLARTFPTWISILTAQHPKHHGIRNNLADASNILNNDTLAKTLQQAGYYTLYASDEKRFSNITPAFGFDHIAGPSMGINDFILGTLVDLPVTNLLTKLPIAKFLLPYNFANRAAAITYQPEQLITLVKQALAERPNKPLFLAIHLCLTHWPYIWAGESGKDKIQPQQYLQSVEAIDKQLNELLAILKKQGLLDNSIVVLLSDHGTALGLPHDTLLDQKNYLGNKNRLTSVPIVRLSNASPDSLDLKHDFTTNSTYGQGTNVASLKQYNPLLAFRRYGNEPFATQRIATPVSLTDIAPTLLALLNMPSLKHSDGLSLVAELQMQPTKAFTRAFFIETGDSLQEIETDQIFLEKVLAKKAGLYRVNPQTALLTMDPLAEIALIKSKQHAVIWGDWLLARYPVSTRDILVKDKITSGFKFKTVTVPGYDVLINLRTGKWTVGLDTAFAKQAPVAASSKQLHDFYGSEI